MVEGGVHACDKARRPVEDFNAAFPTAEAIVRLPRGAWYVTFPTVAEAQAVGRTQSVLNGQPMRARWAGVG